MPDPQTPPVASWRDTLPDDIKGDPSLATIPDTGALAKSFLEARKYIGKDPKSFVSLPDKPDDKEAWGKVYERLGRPASADKYTPLDKALVEKAGVPPEILTTAQAKFHEMGLTDAQTQGILGWYLGDSIKGNEIMGQQTAAEQAKHKEEVAQLLGPNREAKEAMMGAFLGEDGDAMVALANEKGLTGNPVFVKFLLDRAAATMEHKNQMGNGTSAASTSSKQAVDAAIKVIFDKRINDPAYNAAFQVPNSPERKEWDALHAKYNQLQ